jgi:hypothetical protein
MDVVSPIMVQIFRPGYAGKSYACKSETSAIAQSNKWNSVSIEFLSFSLVIPILNLFCVFLLLQPTPQDWELLHELTIFYFFKQNVIVTQQKFNYTR